MGIFVLEGVIQGLGVTILEWGLIVIMFFVIRKVYQEGIAQGRVRVLEDMEKDKEKETTHRAEIESENGNVSRGNDVSLNQNVDSINNQTMNYDPLSANSIRSSVAWLLYSR